MTNDKFILVGLDDEKSGHIAEVLKNPTCKKILNFLGDIKEASEKDISDALKMPINTVEYNLNKLIKCGFIEKTKNFFWSVKGKKIPMYKLARKHIIISPSRSFNLSNLKSLLPVTLIFGVFALILKSFFGIKDNFVQNFAPSIEKAAAGASAETAVLKDVVLDDSIRAVSETNLNLSLVDKILMLPPWVWFLVGALVGVIIYFIFRNYKEVKYGKVN
ncbi:MAG: helix-turn-helix domain-containing protein [Candidatus Pacearchaeota archaeon]|jgi:DNA-binding transcriptional ArsR family regulator